MKKRLVSIFTVISILAIFVAPVGANNQKDNVNDIGNRRVAHRSIISEEKEIGIGKQYSMQIDQSAKLLKDPVINEYVNRVVQNVARNSDVKVPVSVKLIDDPTINAFALPGGFLYMNTGTLLAATEEDQIAGVMAHEIAHVACRHWASNMTKQTLLQFAMLPLMFTPMSMGAYYGLSMAMNGLPLAFLKFSRDDEAEADFFGLQYMYKAGYDPNSYVAFFGKVLEEERASPGSISSIFANHPPTADRIIKCEEEIKALLPTKPEYLVTTSEFSDVQTRLKTLMKVHRKLGPQGPTLDRRKTANKGGQQPTTTPGGSQGSDQPPVLKRKD
ncbi:MAG TPA: M48 family metallopeptidase [Terriglobia bacterium]|nr:M48 family metallopeptidase [Terriglobia bacterium]